MSPTSKAYLQIHFCVLLWGFTAILGKMISLPALPLVWWRMLIVVAALRWSRACGAGCARCRGACAGLRGHRRAGRAALADVLRRDQVVERVGRRDLHRAGDGVRRDDRTLARRARVSPGAISRWASRCCRAWRWWSAACRRACALGIAVGAVSALLVALFGSLNKRLVEHGDPLTVTTLELGAGTVALTLLAPLMPLLLFPGVRRRPAASCPADRDLALLLGLVAGLHAVAVRPVAGRAAPHERVRAAAGGEPGAGLRHRAGDPAAGRAARTHPAVLRRRRRSSWRRCSSTRCSGAPRAADAPEVLGTAESKGAAE